MTLISGTELNDNTDFTTESITGAPYYVNALLYPGNPRWSSNTVTYNFLPAVPAIYLSGTLIDEFSDSDIPDPVTFKAFNDLQKVAAEDALNLWAEVADIQFVRKEDSVLQLSDYLSVGILQTALEAIGKWSDFTGKLTNFIVNTIGTPLVDGADIRFGTASITGSGGAVPPYEDYVTRLNSIRDSIS